jgi:DNA/RNA-binding domain of Phe-tRNA-synthetase-like protein
MPTQWTIDSRVTHLTLGVVEAEGLKIGPAPEELRAYCREVASRVVSSGLRGGEQRRNAVRQLLRAGGYKPAGRNKPAQEYLLRTVLDQNEIPAINNAVDLINAISLDCGLPISLIALERAGTALHVRYGRAGERYVFNRTGQDLDLEGLICVSGSATESGMPLATPVKDSMQGKVRDEDRHVVACIYAPRAEVTPDELLTWSDELGQRLVRWCGAATQAAWVVPPHW